MTAQAHRGEPVTVAAVQTNPRLRDIPANLAAIEHWARSAADRGARLIAFPECAVNGYRYEHFDDAAADAQTVPGPATDRLAAVAAELDAYLAVGIVERDGDLLFNCAALIGPDGVVARYRKTHLPFQAVDRFVSPGDIPFRVVDTPVGRLGMLICFDLRFPEPARVLALAGAQVIVNLTNLPPPGAPQPAHMFQTRAAENHVWLLCASRVGEEGGVPYIGRSAIVSPQGHKIAEAGGEREELLVAEIDPAAADHKDLIIDPGMYEMHLFGARRTELYGPLTQPRPEAGSAP